MAYEIGMHASGYFSKVKLLFANLQNVDFLDEKVGVIVKIF